MNESWELRVSREDLAVTEIGAGVDHDVALGEEQVLFAIGSFAMTANNVTYAVMGDSMKYWNFFPTVDGWGIVPVWGFADVVASAHPGVAIGDRYYGYWPAATSLVVDATRVTDRGLRDGAAHRASLPVVYNQYSKVSSASDASGDPESEAVVSLFRPLFTTSFFIDDMLGEDRFVRAERVAISSASSKTGFALAFCLHRRGVPTIGLTSPGNVDFVSGLGWYDEVVTYDDIDQLDDGAPLVYVDMSGNASVRFAVHSCGAELVASVAVGITHWDASTPAGSLPHPTPELFFAPTQITKRIEEWGQAVVDQRVGASWDEFVAEVDELVSVARVKGADGATSAYLAALDGSADPSVGVIVEP